MMLFLTMSSGFNNININVPSQQTQTEIDIEIDYEELEKDYAILSETSKLFPLNDNDYEGFRKKLISISFNEKYLSDTEYNDIGFGANRIWTYKFGGYFAYEFIIIVYDNKIIKGYFEMRGNQDVWKKEKGLILSKFKNYVKEFEYGFTYYFTFEEDYNRYAYAVQEKLGKQEEIEIPDDLKDEYELLINPLNELSYGYAAGYLAPPLKERLAIGKLVSSGRFDLIENILKGHNPEGRIFALEAILKEGLQNEDIIKRNQNTIKEILKLDILIHVADGCELYYAKAREISEIKWLMENLGLIKYNCGNLYY